jgi:hypothetical protein
MFERKFSEESLERWSKSTTIEGFSCIDIANRLFTPAHLSPSLLEKRISPSNVIDPSGAIAATSEEGKLLYLPDNQVLYFKKTVVDGEVK